MKRWTLFFWLCLVTPAWAQSLDGHLGSSSVVSSRVPPVVRPVDSRWPAESPAALQVPDRSDTPDMLAGERDALSTVLSRGPGYFDYFSVHGSLIAPADVFGLYVNGGWSIGGALGRDLRKRLRAEIEFAYRNNTDDHLHNWRHDIFNRDIDSFSSMVNLTLHPVPNSRRFYPYAGVGVGLSVIDGELLLPDRSTPRRLQVNDTALTYQWFAGTSLRINHRTEFFSEFRFHKTGEFHLDDSSGQPQSIHKLISPSIVWGLRISTH